MLERNVHLTTYRYDLVRNGNLLFRPGLCYFPQYQPAVQNGVSHINVLSSFRGRGRVAEADAIQIFLLLRKSYDVPRLNFPSALRVCSPFQVFMNPFPRGGGTLLAEDQRRIKQMELNCCQMRWYLHFRFMKHSDFHVRAIRRD